MCLSLKSASGSVITSLNRSPRSSFFFSSSRSIRCMTSLLNSPSNGSGGERRTPTGRAALARWRAQLHRRSANHLRTPIRGYRLARTTSAAAQFGAHPFERGLIDVTGCVAAAKDRQRVFGIDRTFRGTSRPADEEDNADDDRAPEDQHHQCAHKHANGPRPPVTDRCSGASSPPTHHARSDHASSHPATHQQRAKQHGEYKHAEDREQAPIVPFHHPLLSAGSPTTPSTRRACRDQVHSRQDPIPLPWRRHPLG